MATTSGPGKERVERDYLLFQRKLYGTKVKSSYLNNISYLCWQADALPTELCRTLTELRRTIVELRRTLTELRLTLTELRRYTLTELRRTLTELRRKLSYVAPCFFVIEG